MSGEHDENDSQRRLRRLADVSNDLTRRLELPVLLRRIVEVAVELLGARYGALGVIGSDRRLEQFIHVGIDNDLADQIGNLPEGKGLLGVLIDDATPVRLKRLADDVRSSGFPAHHPKMDSFLGVPIRVGDEVFGNLYLTESARGTFSPEDEELALALAATAGVAIENARLFDDAAFTARWSSALAEASKHMLQEGSETADIDDLTERARQLADADFASVTVITEQDWGTLRAAGVGVDGRSPHQSTVDSSLVRDAARSGETLVVDDLPTRPDFADVAAAPTLKFGLATPFSTDQGTAVLTLARAGIKQPFRDRDIQMARAFSRHIATAMEREAGREHRRQLELLDERARIARDLHDHVIQRLFAVGLNLQATAGHLPPGDALAVGEQVAEIDGAIAQIRQSIFALNANPAAKERVRGRVLEVVDRYQGRMEQPIGVQFFGPVDLLSDHALTDDIVAVVTEGLANAVRHAGATKASVTVMTRDERIVVEVEDDGKGLPVAPRLRGLSNLRARALARHGDLELTAANDVGTILRWWAPLST